MTCNPGAHSERDHIFFFQFAMNLCHESVFRTQEIFLVYVVPILAEYMNKPRTAKVGAISKVQNLKRGPFGLCETPAGCKKFEKN